MNSRGPLLAIQRTETKSFHSSSPFVSGLADPSSLFRGLKLVERLDGAVDGVARGPLLAIQRTETVR